MKIRDLMSSDLRTIEASASLQDAALEMKKSNVGMLPVLEGGKLVGVVTDRDLVIRGLAAGNSMSVRQVMTPDLLVLNQNTEVDHAIETMEVRGVGRLLVIDDGGSLVGILTAADIAVGLSGDARSGRLSATLGQAHQRPRKAVLA